MTSRLEQLNQTSERKVFLNHFPWKNAIKKKMTNYNLLIILFLYNFQDKELHELRNLIKDMKDRNDLMGHGK